MLSVRTKVAKEAENVGVSTEGLGCVSKEGFTQKVNFQENSK